MITRIKQWLKAFDTWDNDLLQRWVSYTANPTTTKQLLAVIVPFGLGWAFLAYAHILGPWIDMVLGTGPHDPDTDGKIIWRRMWSSALCGPVIAYALLRYCYNRWKNRTKK